jgi:hypothetical protein
MKLLYTTVFFALVIFSAGCNKSAEPVSQDISGTWELRKIEANLTIDYPPGNGTMLKFTKDTYEFYENGGVASSGNYVLVYDDSVTAITGMPVSPGTFKNRIEYINSQALNKIFIEVSGNTLVLLTGATRIADSQVRTTYSRK